MTFPLNRSVHGSLYQNVLISLSQKKKEHYPDLSEVFNSIISFAQLTKINAGTFREFSACAILLRPDKDFDEGEKVLHRALCEQSLKTAQLAIEKKQPAPFDLEGALEKLGLRLPPFESLVRTLSDLIKLTGLKFDNFNTWDQTLRKYYPFEDRSADESTAWFELINLFMDQSDELNAQLLEFVGQSKTAERWREEVDKMRTVSEMTSVERVAKILSSDVFLNLNQSEKRQFLERQLNAIETENQADQIFRSIDTGIQQKFACYRQGDEDISSKKYREAEVDCSEQLSRYQFMLPPTEQSEMGNIHLKFLNKIQVVNSNYNANAKKISNSFSDSCEKAENQWQNLTRKAENLKIPQNSKGKLFWECFKYQLNNHLVFQKNAFDIRMFIIHFQKISSDFSIQFQSQLNQYQLAAPALNLIKQHFSPIWSMSYSSKMRIERRAFELYGDVLKSLDIMKLVRAERQEVYSAISEALNQASPNQISISKKGSNFKKSPNVIAEIDENLPNKQPFDEASNQKTSQKETSQAASSASSSLMDNSTIASKTEPSVKNFESWKAPFDYHFRVARWFDATLPLDRIRFPEYANKALPYQTLMLRLHRLIPLADFFCERGKIITETSYRGEEIKRAILPAEWQTQSGKQRGVVIWATNSKNVCYHRFFHIKLDSELLIDTVKKAFLDTIQNITPTSSNQSEFLTFQNHEFERVEVDELLGVATLTHEKIADETLRLFFVND